MKILRLIASGLAAGAAATLVVVVLALYTVATDTGLDNLGQPDNAPRRASGALIILSPFLVLAFGAIVAAGAFLLRLMRHHTLKALLGSAVVCGLGLGALFASEGYAFDGVWDAAISFGLFSLIGTTVFGLGAVAWWFCSPWKDA